MHMDHEHSHDHYHHHHHDHDHTPMEELVALMKYMAGHNAAHAKELADLADQLQKAGNSDAYEQVMAAVADLKGATRAWAGCCPAWKGRSNTYVPVYCL